MANIDKKTIQWTSVRALSFDIYGTLIDWNAAMITSARETSLGPYLNVSDQALLQGISKHSTNVEREKPKMKKSDVNAEGLVRYGHELGVIGDGDGKVTEELAKEAGRQHGAAIGEYPAFSDTLDAISRLSRHYKLVPISNIDHDSYNKTLSGPLKGCDFTTSYIAEDIGSYKPSLDNFDYLVSHLKSNFGIEGEQHVHVAQSLFHDHEPCKQMGIRSVWVDRYDVLRQKELSEKDVLKGYDIQLRVRSLGELADLVDEAFRAREAEAS